MKDQAIAFFASPEHDCSYLPEKRAGTLFVDPDARLDAFIYSELIRNGFRRSGDFVYRPRCNGCQACVSLRVPVRDFKPTRSDRRNLKRNADLNVTACKPAYTNEQFKLYERYLAARHADGGMDNPAPEKYLDFLDCHWGKVLFYEIRKDEQLLALAVIDHLDDALSAVYTYYDPDMLKRGLGVYAVLWQIEHARQLGLDYVYLGYWIADCQKMSYKEHFRPMEAYIKGSWKRFERGEHP